MFNEFVDNWNDKYWGAKNWQGDILEMPDNAKDEAVFIYLSNRVTWLEDIYPSCFSREQGELATKMLFNSDSQAMPISIGQSMFKFAAETYINAQGDNLSKQDYIDDCYYSPALGRFDDVIDAANFTDEARERIYLYLEPVLRDEIQEAYDAMMPDLLQKEMPK
jgi:hypothetical protein